MFPWSECFRSVGDVWLIWLATAAISACLLRRTIAGLSWRRLRVLVHGERGAAYALPYMLTFPVYLLLVCFMIQASMILIVKLGTVYAAYAAARSAVVWRSADPEPGRDDQDRRQAEEKAQQAAVLAMVPFGSSYRPHLQQMYGGAGLQDQAEAELYFRAYSRALARNRQDAATAGGPGASSFVKPDPLSDASGYRGVLTTKYAYARQATVTSLRPHTNQWNSELTAVVSYKLPIHVPFANRLMGYRDNVSPFHVRQIVSEVRLPLETPRSDNHKLGIPYAPN